MIVMPNRNSHEDSISIACSKLIKKSCETYFSTKKISELSIIVSGGTPDTTKDEYWGGKIIWLTPKDLGKPRNIEIIDSERKITEKGLNSSSAKLVPEGTILLSSRAPIGHLGIASVSLCTNQGFKNIICNDSIFPRYLFHILRASIMDLNKLGRGNTFREITSKIIKNYVIPVPPYKIQKNVANFLDSLYISLSGYAVDMPNLPLPFKHEKDTILKIKNIMINLNAVNNYKKNIDYTLTEDNGQINRLIKNKLRSVYNDLVNKYGVINVDDVIINGNYGTSKKCKYERSLDSNPVLRIPNINSGQVNLNDLKYCELSKKEKEKTILHEGDILIVRTCGSSNLVGRSAVINNIDEPTSFASYLIRIQCDQNIISPYFMQLMLKYLRLSGALYNLARTTAGQYNVSLGRLRGAEIPLPPKIIQAKIVNYFLTLQSLVDSLREVQTKMNVNLGQLHTSILDLRLNT